MTEEILVLHVDEPSVTAVSRRRLEFELESISVIEAPTAPDGLEILEERAVDCVVSDYRLPAMDGLEFLRQVRTSHPDLPFILFTGRGSETVASEAIAAGVTDYLQKSASDQTYSLLANRIENVVSGERAERRARNKERALTRERDKLAALFDNTIDPTIEYEYRDGEPIVQRVNEAFESAFGYDPATAVGRHINELVVPPGYREEAQEIDDRVRQGEHVDVEVRRQAADGELRDFLFRNIPIPDADSERGYAIYTDITGRKEREQRLQVLNRVLRHNLRNDMNVILGVANLVKSSVDDPSIETELESLERVGGRLLERSQYARVIEETLSTNWSSGTAIDVVPLVEEEARGLETDYDEVSVSMELPETAVAATGATLRTAVRELLVNAVEHSPGETTIEVSVDRTVQNDADRVGIVVADDGPGIPVHERTVLIEGAETSLEHGSGLGLWLVRWIVHGNGGSLDFEERDPTGSRVTIFVPAAAPSTDVVEDGERLASGE